MVLDADFADRRLLADVLEKRADLVVVAASSVESLALGATEPRPDVVFADIRSTAALTAIIENPVLRDCPLIAMSAVPSDAVRAFDVGARDFLVKPHARIRVALALARATQHARQLPTNDVRPAESPERDQRLNVTADDIELVTANERGSTLHMPHRMVNSDLSVSRVEARLDPRHYVRTHRSTLVNVLCIVRLVSGPDHWTLELRSGARVPVSKRRVALVRAHLMVAHGAATAMYRKDAAPLAT